MKPEDAPEMRCGSTHQAEDDEPDDEEEVEASAAGIVDGRIQLRVAAVAVEVGRSLLVTAPCWALRLFCRAQLDYLPSYSRSHSAALVRDCNEQFL